MLTEATYRNELTLNRFKDATIFQFQATITNNNWLSIQQCIENGHQILLGSGTD